jgi:multidrug efflux pump subunit AcrA (membrane-fusion protein)
MSQQKVGSNFGEISRPSGEAGIGTTKPRGSLILAIALIVTAALLAWGIRSRIHDGKTLRTETSQVAITPVSVVSPKQTPAAQEIILPGNVEPFINSPIYSRTNGYLKQWSADIGAHVRKGQLLAVIETPEVDQQLEQSLSNLNTAKANLALSEITKNRYEGLLKTNAVSQQDVDNAVGSYNANKAIVEASEANVKQLQALQSFENIYAPFDGVVTARNTDIGDLINSGSSSGVKTDLFQIDVANPSGTLFTGSYAEVHLKVPTQASTYLLPVNTLIFRSAGLQVGTVKDGKVALTAVTPGHDLGDQIEIVAGLKPGDQVIVNPPDSIISGQEVQIVQATLPGDAK